MRHRPASVLSWIVYSALLAGAVSAFLIVRRAGEHLVAPPPEAQAAAHAAHADPGTLLHVLLALISIILASRGLGYVFRWLGQPPVIGEVFAGVGLGPSLLGRACPQVQAFLFPPDVTPHLGVLAQVGVILFMFLVGLELDTHLLRKRSHATVAISHASIDEHPWFDGTGRTQRRTRSGRRIQRPDEGLVIVTGELDFNDEPQHRRAGAQHHHQVRLILSGHELVEVRLAQLYRIERRQLSAQPIALVSTTTQRAGEGLVARISYMFGGMRELVAELADARLAAVIMPVLGAGHGQIEAPLAFVGMLLAVAEAALYGQGSQRLRRVTIVIFQRNSQSAPEVEALVVRRALALIASRIPVSLAKSA